MLGVSSIPASVRLSRTFSPAAGTDGSTPAAAPVAPPRRAHRSRDSRPPCPRRAPAQRQRERAPGRSPRARARATGDAAPRPPTPAAPAQTRRRPGSQDVGQYVHFTAESPAICAQQGGFSRQRERGMEIGRSRGRLAQRIRSRRHPRAACPDSARAVRELCGLAAPGLVPTKKLPLPRVFPPCQRARHLRLAYSSRALSSALPRLALMCWPFRRRVPRPHRLASRRRASSARCRALSRRCWARSAAQRSHSGPWAGMASQVAHLTTPPPGLWSPSSGAGLGRPNRCRRVRSSSGAPPARRRRTVTAPRTRCRLGQPRAGPRGPRTATRHHLVGTAPCRRGARRRPGPHVGALRRSPGRRDSLHEVVTGAAATAPHPVDERAGPRRLRARRIEGNRGRAITAGHARPRPRPADPHGTGEGSPGGPRRGGHEASSIACRGRGVMSRTYSDNGMGYRAPSSTTASRSVSYSSDS